MAPIPASSTPDPPRYVSAMREQWANPKDILSIVMIIGGSLVQHAVAQLAGSGPGSLAPVAFSFGWVAHSISMLASALGDGRLLPQPDCPSTLINVRSKYARTNKSWVLGRLLRDEEHRLEHECRLRGRGHADRPRHSQGEGLIVAFYRTVPKQETDGGMPRPARDWVYWAGVAVILLQLGVSIVPFVLHGNWIVFFVTLAGTLLVQAGSALPQWRREKYAARQVRQGTREISCLTRGNGAPVVMVFVADQGLRLENLAGTKNEHCHFTLVATAILCVLWILLLLTVQGLDGDAWYLFSIGAAGMAQNVLAAGARRRPDALGFHLELVCVVDEPKVMKALEAAEAKERGVGVALLPTFFPGPLRKEEKEYWDRRRAQNEELEQLGKRGVEEGKSVPVTEAQTSDCDCARGSVRECPCCTPSPLPTRSGSPDNTLSESLPEHVADLAALPYAQSPPGDWHVAGFDGTRAA
ncbi:hypothetical protein C8Q76DRAFT_857914 [Earliella scabrosa]|nr:hypothetical protein C8Q76DRAFT_857914 [Earliella scabrosa]